MSANPEQPLHALRLEQQTRRAKYLADLFQSGELTLDAPYQRGSVWNEDQQVALIYSFLVGIPIPSVILNQRALAGWAAEGDPEIVAIDGKQRILTLSRWFRGDLFVPANWFEPQHYQADQVVTSPSGPLISYLGLTKPSQLDLSLGMTIGVAEACVTDLAAEANIFLLVNGGGTPQNQITMERAQKLVRDGL